MSELLHKAISKGDMERVEQLLGEGISVEAISNRGYTPLVQAVLNEQVGILRLLLEKGAKLDGLDNDGDTPLLVAIKTEKEEIAKELIEQGADYSRELNGESSLKLALDRNCLMALDAMLNQAQKENKHILWKPDSQGYQLLHQVVLFGKAEAIDTLVKHGVYLDAQDKQGQTALHLAVRHTKSGHVRRLVKHGINTQIRDHQGQTAEEEAEKLGYTSLKDIIKETTIEAPKPIRESKVSQIEQPSIDSISEEEWEQLRPHIEEQARGRPRTNIRGMVEAIKYIIQTGSSWRKLPKGYPHWKRVYYYYQHWQKEKYWKLINRIVSKGKKRGTKNMSKQKASS